MSLWRFWTNLAPKTRLYIGVGVMTWATAGLYLSDAAEKEFGLEPTPEEKEKLHKMVPRIRTVERER